MEYEEEERAERKEVNRKAAKLAWMMMVIIGPFVPVYIFYDNRTLLWKLAEIFGVVGMVSMLDDTYGSKMRTPKRMILFLSIVPFSWAIVETSLWYFKESELSYPLRLILLAPAYFGTLKVVLTIWKSLRLQVIRSVKKSYVKYFHWSVWSYYFVFIPAMTYEWSLKVHALLFLFIQAVMYAFLFGTIRPICRSAVLYYSKKMKTAGANWTDDPELTTAKALKYDYYLVTRTCSFLNNEISVVEEKVKTLIQRMDANEPMSEQAFKKELKKIENDAYQSIKGFFISIVSANFLYFLLIFTGFLALEIIVELEKMYPAVINSSSFFSMQSFKDIQLHFGVKNMLWTWLHLVKARVCYSIWTQCSKKLLCLRNASQKIRNLELELNPDADGISDAEATTTVVEFLRQLKGVFLDTPDCFNLSLSFQVNESESTQERTFEFENEPPQETSNPFKRLTRKFIRWMNTEYMLKVRKYVGRASGVIIYSVFMTSALYRSIILKSEFCGFSILFSLIWQLSYLQQFISNRSAKNRFEDMVEKRRMNPRYLTDIQQIARDISSFYEPVILWILLGKFMDLELPAESPMWMKFALLVAVPGIPSGFYYFYIKSTSKTLELYYNKWRDLVRLSPESDEEELMKEAFVLVDEYSSNNTKKVFNVLKKLLPVKLEYKAPDRNVLEGELDSIMADIVSNDIEARATNPEWADDNLARDIADMKDYYNKKIKEWLREDIILVDLSRLIQRSNEMLRIKKKLEKRKTKTAVTVTRIRDSLRIMVANNKRMLNKIMKNINSLPNKQQGTAVIEKHSKEITKSLEALRLEFNTFSDRVVTVHEDMYKKMIEILDSMSVFTSNDVRKQFNMGGTLFSILCAMTFAYLLQLIVDQPQVCISLITGIVINFDFIKCSVLKTILVTVSYFVPECTRENINPAENAEYVATNNAQENEAASEVEVQLNSAVETSRETIDSGCEGNEKENRIEEPDCPDEVKHDSQPDICTQSASLEHSISGEKPNERHKSNESSSDESWEMIPGFEKN